MASLKMSISVIGSGNVAWHLTKRLFACGYLIDCVFSRNPDNARALAEQVKSKAVDTIAMLPLSDLYIISVKDDAYQEVIASFPKTTAICVHTSGSSEMKILENLSDNYGVVYPFQSFSKNKIVDFENVPVCIEASNPQVESLLITLANELSPITCLLNTEQRMHLHLAGVFASNFSNGMYVIAQQILQKENIDFKIALPLINETAEKVNSLFPIDAQTGPAIRNDINIMNKHIRMMEDEDWKELYRLISKIIQKQQHIL